MPDWKYLHPATARMICVLATAWALASASPASAASEDGDFAARGMGARSCVDIVTLLTGAERDMTALQLSAWVAGYLSHANRTTADSFDVMPIHDTFGVATVVARLCEANPEMLLEPVMARLVSLMAEAKQTSVSELTVVSADGQEMYVRQSVMAAAQRNLTARGFLEAGNDDGLFGPRTRAAFSEFQKAIGLPESGFPDAVTLFVLFEAQ